MTINEYEAFLKWHFENWKLNCAHSDSLEEARKIYDRIYQNNKPNHIAERERGFMAWKAGKAQAVPLWISVEDKWPNYGDLILVVISGQTQTRIFFRDGSDCSKDWIEPVNDDDSHNTICWEKVTHWMPLPKAPSESGAEQ